jgi:hypothetical protein
MRRRRRRRRRTRLMAQLCAYERMALLRIMIAVC